MNIIYYVEINLVCIIILLLFRRQMHYKSERFSTAEMILNQLIWVTVLFCIADMVTGVFHGQTLLGTRTILEISNMVYLESLTVISYLWMRYVMVKMKGISNYRYKMNLIRTLPLIAFTMVAITNPLTQVLYRIDANNFYVRNPGIFIHWIFTWIYLIIATVETGLMIAKEKNKQKRKEYVPLLHFIIMPIIACVIQMMFYGVSSAQVGVTISIVMVCLNQQNNLVLTDSLTGLNNRRGLEKYVEDLLSHHEKVNLTLLMIDLNNFKHVNDTYGHLMGDNALQTAAQAIKNACAMMPTKLFQCRYGGDEFVILGHELSPEDIVKMETLIRKELSQVDKKSSYPYMLAASIGVANGPCSEFSDMEHLFQIADEAMYDDKKSGVAVEKMLLSNK